MPVLCRSVLPVRRLRRMQVLRLNVATDYDVHVATALQERTFPSEDYTRSAGANNTSHHPVGFTNAQKDSMLEQDTVFHAVGHLYIEIGLLTISYLLHRFVT